jgi:hypothetical protein
VATSGGIVLGRDSRRSSIRATASGTFHRVAAVTLCLILSGRGNATVSGRREVGAAPTTGPAVVYVTDFELDAQRIKAETSPLPPPPGPLGGILPKPPGTPKEPAVRARELVNPMATSLVEELTKAGLNARRLSAGEPRPAQGWLVRGIFTQLDEGNRMRRAVIGFGAGQTQMQVAVAVDDLSQGVPKPLYETDVSADSGKMPGAGSMIALAPPVAAARFALAGRDQERSVRRAAAKIASDVVGRIRKGT